jgi:hypothetical protein
MDLQAAMNTIGTATRGSSTAAAATRNGHHYGQLGTGLLVSHITRIPVSMSFLWTDSLITRDAGSGYKRRERVTHSSLSAPSVA